MFITNRKKIIFPPFIIKNSIYINVVMNFKLLGVYLDIELSFKENVLKISALS